MSDPINPDYYMVGGLESIRVIETFWPDRPYRWAAFKYLVRAGRKNPETLIEDLQKAVWWLEREIAHEETKRVQAHVAKVAGRAPLACPDTDDLWCNPPQLDGRNGY